MTTSLAVLLVTILVMAGLAWLMITLARENRVRSQHRFTATNCKFYYGDNQFADWGTCGRCPSEVDQ